LESTLRGLVIILLDTLEHIHVALGNSRPWLLTVLQNNN